MIPAEILPQESRHGRLQVKRMFDGRLRRARKGNALCYLIDIDGTIMNTSVANKGAADFIEELNTKGIKYLLLTNSIKSPSAQVDRLRNAGVNVNENCIINPIVAVNEYLKEKGIRKAKIIGTKDEIDQVIVESEDNEYEIVILLDFEKGNRGYNDLQEIVNAMGKGIEVITASISPYYYKAGKKTIDTGAFVALLQNVCGKEITNFGKPSRTYFAIAGRMLNEDVKEILVIGDDWSTDIKGANEWGAKSVLIKSGKYVEGDENKEKPYLLIDNLGEMKKHRTIAST